MNPKVPALLSRALELAGKTLDRPTGDLRRLEALDRLYDEVREAIDWPTDQPRRFINGETVALVQLLRRIEREGPLGDPRTLRRSEALARVLLPYVKEDAGAALDCIAHPPTTSQNYNASK